VRPPLFTPRALEILAERAEGRVELQRQRARAETQRRHARQEMETQTARLNDLEELIRGIDRVIGGPLAPRRPSLPPPGSPGRLL
jgi:hypothetical protein